MNNRFTDINVGYKEPDPDDKRTNEEVLEELKKQGVEVVKSDEKPPDALF